jgi:LPS-assembly lipoprotein
LQQTRFIIWLVFFLGLAGCGYKPLYGTGSDGRGVVDSLSSIAVQETDSRAGQLVRNKLLSSMRPAGTAHQDAFTLSLAPQVVQSTPVDQSRPGIQRRRLRLIVFYQLTEMATGAQVGSGKTFSSISYDIVHEPVADLQAEANALSRAADEVGTDIHTRLAAFMASRGST